MKPKYKMPNGVTVYHFCMEKAIPYNNVHRSIRYRLKKYPEKSLDEIISDVIEIYLKLYQNKKIINFIKKMEETNFNILLISKTLNIEWRALYKVVGYGFSKREAFYILWFLYDIKSSTGRISISKKQILKLIELQKRYKFDGKVDLRFIFVLVKMEDEKALNYLLNVRSKTIKGIIRKNVFNDDYYRNYGEDILSELIMQEWVLYQKIYLNNIPQIMKYLNKTAKYAVINYVNNDKDKICLMYNDAYLANCDYLED